MPRVAAGDPDVVAARNRADERHQVGRRPPDPCPAVRDARPAADEPLDELVEPLLDQRGRLDDVRLLGLQRRVTVAADHEPPVRQLLPVVVSGARIVRARVTKLGQRLGGEHLATRRPHLSGELGQERGREPVARDDDDVRVELRRARRPARAHGCRRRRGGVRSKPPHPARRLQAPSGGCWIAPA